MELKFYICEHCGNIIAYVKNKGVPVMCCGQKMMELIPNTSEGAGEKHIPVVTADDNKITVSVGAVGHPMEEKHYIEWICLETGHGFQMKHLKPGEKPELCHIICCESDKEVKAAYAYCNLHGLWKS